MAQPLWLKKYLTMKPEVKQIYNDLDAWLNYCRFHMMQFYIRVLRTKNGRKNANVVNNGVSAKGNDSC